MMGAYFKGPFTNFDFLDPFQTPRHPISVRWRRIAVWGTYRLWFAVVGDEMELSHWVVKNADTPCRDARSAPHPVAPLVVLMMLLLSP